MERHPELPADQRTNLEFHAAQMFALGGMNERAIAHIGRARRFTRADSNGLDAHNAFLLLDRARLVAARRKLAEGE